MKKLVLLCSIAAACALPSAAEASHTCVSINNVPPCYMEGHNCTFLGVEPTIVVVCVPGKG